VSALTEIDHALVLAKPRNVNADDQRVIEPDIDLASAGSCYQLATNKLQVSGSGELALHMDAYKITIEAPISYPLCELRLVSTPSEAGIDDPSAPAMTELVEALKEPAGAARRITCYVPDDLSVCVGKSTFRSFINYVRDCRPLVHNQQQPLI